MHMWLATLCIGTVHGPRFEDHDTSLLHGRTEGFEAEARVHCQDTPPCVKQHPISIRELIGAWGRIDGWPRSGSRC